MTDLPLFDEPTEFNRSSVAGRLSRLAGKGIYIGTSSWRYPGWLGTVYTPERYQYRGKFAKKRFNDDCIAEYAETFPLVGCDFSFYGPQEPQFWDRLMRRASPGLRYLVKVPEEFTVKKYSSHARYGPKAGQSNPSYLDADTFQRAFLDPLEPHATQVPAIVIEFGTFSKAAYPEEARFFDDLDRFLSALPTHFRYAVEIRNEDFLRPEYFSVLREHRVAHVFNAWTRMPPLAKQIGNPLAFTADFRVARALLRVGRPYETAVKMFEPYARVQEVNHHARASLQELIYRSEEDGTPLYMTINNRLEGFAPGTIEAVVSDIEV